MYIQSIVLVGCDICEELDCIMVRFFMLDDGCLLRFQCSL